MAKKTIIPKNINMSEVEGSASQAIINWWGNYKFEDVSPKKIYDELIGVIPENKIHEPRVQNLLKNILKSKNSQQAYIAIGNFVLSGDHESVVSGTKEKDRKFIKNFGR